MIEYQRKGNAWLLYDHLITKFLEHFGFHLEEENSIANAIKIGTHYLSHMQYAYHDRVLVHKGTKTMGVSQRQQVSAQPHTPQQ